MLYSLLLFHSLHLKCILLCNHVFLYIQHIFKKQSVHIISYNLHLIHLGLILLSYACIVFCCSTWYSMPSDYPFFFYIILCPGRFNYWLNIVDLCDHSALPGFKIRRKCRKYAFISDTKYHNEVKGQSGRKWFPQCCALSFSNYLTLCFGGKCSY